MDEDSTPAAPKDGAGDSDDFDISGEDHSQDTFDEGAADSSDDDSSNDDDGSDAGDDDAEDGDNAPSDSDDDSGDDDKKSKTGDKTGTPAFDKDLDDWAVKHGHEAPENDKERKLLQTIRNGQRDFSKRQSEKKVTDAVGDAVKPDSSDDDSVDETQKRLDRMDATLASESYRRQATEYFLTQAQAGTPVPDAEGEAMATLLTEYKDKDGEFGVKFLLNDIPRWHRLARLGISSGSDNSEELGEAEKKAAQAERERIAKASKASGPTKSAKQQSPAEKKSEIEKIWEDDDV